MLQYSHFSLFTILFFVLVQQQCSVSQDIATRQMIHRDVRLTDSSLDTIAMIMDDDSKLIDALGQILIPRVPGTANHSDVIDYITAELKGLGWDVEYDVFTAHTPVGRRPFSNIIATPNPHADRFLDIACHFDSKEFHTVHFVGAVDSAVPCAMMLQLAHSLNGVFSASKNPDLSIRYIFFDGEEAFLKWTDTDSLYGSRHLASKWNAMPYKDMYKQLDRIDVLVLLDLLGARKPVFYSFYQNTLRWYQILVQAEERLHRQGHFKEYEGRYFLRMSTDSQVDDDHVPFIERGVPVVHLIPVPFPDVWHTPDDNLDVVHFPTVKNLLKILAVFIVEYLGVL